MRLKTACHLLGLIVTCMAPAASAVDGVLEINEACAVNTGCFAGDTAGFPVTITSPGSYRLTGNLSSGGAGSRIEISADNVSVDLNGNNVGSALGSTISGTGDYTRISNGVVEGRGIGTPAISITSFYGHIDHVRTSGNVHLGAWGQVTDSYIRGTGTGDEDQSLRTGRGSVVTGNTVIGSAGAIEADVGSVVRNNAIRTGCYSSGGIRCSDCTIDSNAITVGCDVGFGIGASRSVVTSNVVKCNQFHPVGGVHCSECTVIGNVVSDCGAGAGLVDSSGKTGYVNNQFDNNNGGNANPQVSGGIEMGTNICGGDTTCP